MKQLTSTLFRAIFSVLLIAVSIGTANAQCDMSGANGQYPLFAVTPNPIGMVTHITFGQYAGSQYTHITEIFYAHLYEFTHAAGSYATVRIGAVDGPVLGSGYTPLTVEATSTSDLYVHWTLDEFCTVGASGFHTTTVQDMAPICDMSGEGGQWPVGAITPDPAGAVTTIATDQYEGSQYSHITGVLNAHEYAFTHAALSYATIRIGAVDGPVLGAGYTPLTVLATSTSDLYVHWTVDGVCTVGNTAGVYPTTVQDLTPPCDNPTGQTVSNIQTSQATLGWDAVAAATKYKLKVRPVGGSWTFHTVLAPTLFKVKGNLTLSTDYEWKVKTVCASNSPTNYGPMQYFSTLGNPCSNPATITMTGVNPTQTDASWSTVAEATSYKLKYRPVGGSTWKYKTINAPQTSRSLYNLLPDTQYEYKIRTDCGSSSEPYTASAYFNTLSCEKPGNRTATNIGDNTATANWDAVSGAVSYKVKFRINNTATWSYRNVAAPATSAQFNGLQADTTYQWKVKTFCSPTSNYSTYSGNNLFHTTGTGGSQSRLAEDRTEDATGKVSVYPNPTTGELTIDLGDLYEDVYVTIRNMTGQVVYEQNLKEARQLQTTIEGAKGLYTVEVHTADGMSGVFRVVKE